MKKMLLATTLLFSPFLIANAHETSAAAKVVFADNSYCGNFSGDIYNGKRFRLWLAPEQELVIRNKGGDQVNIAYVDGPSGRLEGDDHRTYSSFFTKANGNHFIKVYGTSHYSSVDFCAY